MKILAYIRPWNENSTVTFLKNIFKTAEIITISDFRHTGDIWIKKLPDGKYENCSLSSDEVDECIIRCRYLRSQKKKFAEEKVINTYVKLEKLFEEECFDICYMAIPDCYSMDIICKIAQKNNIKVVSVVQSFIEGYSRFTLYGEGNKARLTVTNEEAKRVKEKLINIRYKPNFKLNKEKGIIQLYIYFIKRKIIQNIYFPFRKIIENDFDNYHYNTLEYKKGLKNYLPRNLNSFFTKIEDIEFKEKDIYLPLHYTPEATVDYWTDSTQQVLYEDFIISFIKKSDKSLRFLIKEHPAKYGKRDVSFYKRLLDIENVILIHPYENSNIILDDINFVLVTTGSVGVEAYIRNKTVFTTSKNYYSDLARIKRVNYLKESDLIMNNNQVDVGVFIKELLCKHIEMKSAEVDDIKRYIRIAYDIEI